jgi:sporulation protein YlmC with PRC-barrel domain
MRLELKTPVRCTDALFGELADVVIDPQTRRVTHLIVEPRHQATMVGSRLVPIELADHDEVDSGEEPAEIRLQCTVEDIGKLELVQDMAYMRLGGFPVDDPDWDVGVSDVLAAPNYGLGDPTDATPPADVAITYDRIPKGEVEIRRASLVISADGHEVGHVEALSLDREGSVTHLVLERGHLWGQRDITIPIDAVARIETDAVSLGLTKDEVAALPAVRVHRR